MSEGLEDAVVADTRLSEVDGAAGRLTVAGRSIGELAPEGFEAACAALWNAVEDGSHEAERLRDELGEARVRAHARLGALGDALERHDAMDALRAGLAHLSVRGDDPVAPCAAAAVIVAAWWRRQEGEPSVPPDPSLGHAADLLRMLRGAPSSERAVRALDVYLATVAEHGMNASTFAARVVASTDSDLVSAVVAAVGALKGRLHGGAPGPVLDMLDAIGSVEQVEPWLRARLRAGERIMGIGHRVYRRRDPRAEVLGDALHALAGDSPRVVLAREVEACATRLLAERHPDRPMHANVELYTALLLEALGIDRALFTGTFAVGRMAGWCAHVREQRGSRLIRPRARYVGARAVIPAAGRASGARPALR